MDENDMETFFDLDSLATTQNTLQQLKTPQNTLATLWQLPTMPQYCTDEFCMGKNCLYFLIIKICKYPQEKNMPVATFL